MESFRAPRRCLIAACLLAAVGITSAQTTWHVDAQALPPGNGTLASPYTSVQYAISQSATVNGDTLLVAPGVYAEHILVFKELTIRSSGGPLVTTLRATGAGHVVGIVQKSQLEGFTIEGLAASGGPSQNGIRVDDEFTMRHCIVRDHTWIGLLSFYDAQAYQCNFTGNAIGVYAGNFGGNTYADACIVEFNGVNLFADGGSAGNWFWTSLIGTGDPGFWDYGSRDFHLRPGSPAIDAGTAFGVPPDPDGSPPDIGAIMYDASYAPAPATYCTGKLNSDGCVPAIGSSGTASATPPALFTITAVQVVAQKPGLLFFGFAPRAVPFQGGFHCVEPPIKRVGVQVSGGAGTCGGTMSFDMGGYIQSGIHPALLPGSLVNCQWWGRDPLEPAGFGSSLSDALVFGIAP